jgi:hypothetical protein
MRARLLEAALLAVAGPRQRERRQARADGGKEFRWDAAVALGLRRGEPALRLLVVTARHAEVPGRCVAHQLAHAGQRNAVELVDPCLRLFPAA